MIAGEISIGDEKLGVGDGAAIDDSAGVDIASVRDAEFLLFDLE